MTETPSEGDRCPRAFDTIVGALVLALLAACGSDLSTVQCTSSAQCARGTCVSGICQLDDTTAEDADEPDDADAVEDVGNNPDIADANDDAAADVAPGDTGSPDADDAADTDNDAALDASGADDASDAADAPDLSDVPVDPELVAPAGLEASDGTAPAVVALTWEPVEGADGYRVYRDGTAVADVDETRWDDLDATRGAAAGIEGVAATTDDPFAVIVTWPAAGPSSPGTPHSYEVATLRDEALSAPSAPDQGYTSAAPAAGYDIEINGAVTAVDGRTWRDTEAPPPSIAITAVTAAWEDTGVQLAAVGTGAIPGTGRMYRVRAYTEAGGVGPWSAEATGRRNAGSLEFAWERSAADSDGAYGTIATTATPAATDTAGPPVGDARYYRVTVSAAGAASVTSDGVRVARP